MRELDKAFHSVALATENIHWRDFREVGLDEPYYDYYYAEDELYIIRDRVYLRLWFCKARSPKEAWQKYEDECRSLAIAWGEERDAEKRGRWVKLDMHPHLADHKCTACGESTYVPTCMGKPIYLFCPWCGARMEGEENEAD